MNSLALLKACEVGLGVTVLPEQLLLGSLHLKKLHLIRLKDMKMENQMLALFHKDKYITKPFQVLLPEKLETNFQYIDETEFQWISPE